MDMSLKIAKILKEIDDKKEEIAKAFLATYNCKPDEVEIVTYPDPEHGGMGWRIRKIEPANGALLPDEVIAALKEAERALIGADACPDPECGSDQCTAYQMIRALFPDSELVFPDSELVPGPSHKAIKQVEGPRRPRLNLRGAKNILDSLIESPRYNIPEATREIIKDFRDNWFAFHEQNLKEIERQIPKIYLRDAENLPQAIGLLCIDFHKKAIADPQPPPDPIPDLYHESLTQINQVVQAWYSEGVSRAIDTAPMRMDAIGKIINAYAAKVIGQSKAEG